MNKKTITGVITLLLSLVTMILNIPIIPVVLFGTSIALLGNEIFKRVMKESEREDKISLSDEASKKITEQIKYSKPKAKVPENLDKAIDKIIESPDPSVTVSRIAEVKKEVVKIKKVTPKKSTGTKLVKPLVEEQLNPKFVESVKKTPVKKQISKVIKGDPLTKPKPKRKYKKRKPRVQKEK